VVANDWDDGRLRSSGSMLSTEGDSTESEDGDCLVLELGSRSSAIIVDTKESWSENATVGLRLSLGIVTTGTVVPPLL
jgi:hypothetical protein